MTYFSLVPICLGVGISCIDGSSSRVGETFNFLGFLNASISNLCFSSRAVISKQLFAYCKGYNYQIDETELFSSISRIGLIILVPTAILVEFYDIYALFHQSNWITFFYIIRLFILNGIAYSTYNLVSFLVLSRTDLITHAVLNVFRRVFIIMFTSWFFKVEITYLNGIGVGVAVLGVLLFAFSKQSWPSRKKKLVVLNKNVI